MLLPTITFFPSGKKVGHTPELDCCKTHHLKNQKGICLPITCIASSTDKTFH
jgi:hypothetical protein